MTAVEAQPLGPDEWAKLPGEPGVVEFAGARGITEIVHFTTMPNGVLGILAEERIKSRNRLREDQYLEHIRTLNAPDRSRDRPWHDYVSLSTTKINSWLFASSKSRWHRDSSWAVFAFSPEILGDPGVVFTTTNNAYNEYCRRARGLAGFKQMFAEQVIGYNGRVYNRARIADNLTTDLNAEVLYPGELKLDRLTKIYVMSETDVDDISGHLGALNLDHLAKVVAHTPEVFY